MTEEQLSSLTPDQLSALIGADPLQVDMERLARLHAIAHNPYHKLAFDDLDTPGMLRVCIYGFFEARAYTALARLDRSSAHASAQANACARDAAGPPALQIPRPGLRSPRPAARAIPTRFCGSAEPGLAGTDPARPQQA